MSKVINNIAYATLGAVIMYLLMWLIPGMRIGKVQTVEKIKTEIVYKDTCYVPEVVSMDTTFKRGKTVKRKVSPVKETVTTDSVYTIGIDSSTNDTIFGVIPSYRTATYMYDEPGLKIVEEVSHTGTILDFTRSVTLDTPLLTKIIQLPPEKIVVPVEVEKEVKTGYNRIVIGGFTGFNENFGGVCLGYENKKGTTISVDYSILQRADNVIGFPNNMTHDLRLRLTFPLITFGK